MRILFLTQVLPYPLDAGPKVRIYYMLRYLSQYHEVTLLSFVRSTAERSHAANLDPYCEKVVTVPLRRARSLDAWHYLRSTLNGQPFLIARDEQSEMFSAVQSQLGSGSYHAVHADQLAMAQYAVDQKGVKRVLDEHNAVWMIVYRMWQNDPSVLKRLVEQLEWQKMRRYETDILRRFDQVITVTDEDRKALQPTGHKGPPTVVIPICVDTAELAPVARQASSHQIVCVGNMFYPPNVDGVLWFGKEVLPLILAECPDTDFVVVGGRPDKRILEMAAGNPRIQVTGYVEDTTALLRESAVFVVPLRAGGGMRVKILDAWARGIPVVSTTLGCEGIQVRAGENMLIADSSPEQARAVLRILRDPGLGQQLADNGRRWVQDHYDWRVVYRSLDAIYPRQSS